MDAVHLLERYRDKYCVYNDDVQGTAGITLAGMINAAKIKGTKLRDEKYLFLGAGSAGIGLANLLCSALVAQGMTLKDAQSRVSHVRCQRPARVDAHRSRRFPEALCAQARADAELCRRYREHQADDDHWRQHHRRRVHPKGDRGHVAHQRTPRRSSRCRTRPRMPSARPNRPIPGQRATRSMPPACSSRRFTTTDKPSCRAKPTTSTSSRRLEWRSLQPRLERVTDEMFIEAAAGGGGSGCARLAQAGAALSLAGEYPRDRKSRPRRGWRSLCSILASPACRGPLIWSRSFAATSTSRNTPPKRRPRRRRPKSEAKLRSRKSPRHHRGDGSLAN